MLKRLTPFISYRNLQSGVDFFESKLGFNVIYSEGEPATMTIVERDKVQLFLHTHTQHHDPYEPAYRIEVNDIDTLFEEINNRGHEIFHPNSKGVDKKPWGAQEFAVKDPNNKTCITFYEQKST